MKNETILTWAFVILLLTIIVIVAELSHIYTVQNYGVVKTVNISIYSDIDCLEKLTEINWEYITPNETKQRSVYAKNEGTTSITLSMYTENWNPENCTLYMNCDWNATNVVLEPQEICMGNVELTIFANTTESGISNFSFDIIFVGSET